MSIYDDAGTRQGLIEGLTEMRGHLTSGEMELLSLTDSALQKLSTSSDADYAALDLFPDFDK
jgi:hypothetical protein